MKIRLKLNRKPMRSHSLPVPALAGKLCRCAGHQRIRAAVHAAADALPR